MRFFWVFAVVPSCDFYPEATEAIALPTATDCSADILIPNPSGGAPLVATDVSSEVYGAAPAPSAVHLGLPSSDPSTSVAFTWRTDVDTLASAVEWGVADALDQRSEGASFLYGGAIQGTGTWRLHEVHLCGALQPDTTYSYRVGGPGGWSPTHSFTTAPAPGTPSTLTVAISGDARGSYDTWATVVAQMEAYDPDFYLFTGDIVDLGPNQTEWDAWFAAAGDVFARKLFLPTHGNHEFLAQHYFAQFALPGNEEWFAARFGDVTVVSLNDTVRDASVWEAEEITLMDEAFGAAPGDWKLVEHHQPVYSTCTTHGSHETLRGLWTPVFDRHRVDLVLNGHNHTYERSLVIAGGQEVAAADGTTYVVTGGAGADLYPTSQAEWFGLVSNPVEHFVIAEISPTEIAVTARDLSGTVIDAFTVPRKGN